MILGLMKRKDLKPVILNKSKKELTFQKLNDNKIRKELKWKQSITIKKALNKTINWYKEHKDLF